MAGLVVPDQTSHQHMKTVKELRDALQDALESLDEGAPVYLCVDNEIYDIEIQVNAHGKLGPGSVLILKVPLK